MSRNDSPFDMQIKLLMIGDSGEPNVSFRRLLNRLDLTHVVVSKLARVLYNP